ncbi:MAG: hypothetical protein CTY16_03015 [Methylobacter sp.]|nr:MAG: hypothetical protein CTY16_03015 [Methylobacter sp.]
MNDKEDFQIEMQQLQQQIQGYLQEHWRFFLAEGIFFIVLGIGAMAIPQFFTEAIVILLGWIMLFGGIAHVGRALVFSDMPGFWLWVFMGLLQIIVGYLFITTPLVGVLTITLLMTLFFAFEGIAKISLALLMRPLAHWGLMLFSGASSLVFALIIIISWSETAHWLLGVFLGINMIFMGFSLVKMSWHHKGGS